MTEKVDIQLREQINKLLPETGKAVYINPIIFI